MLARERGRDYYYYYNIAVGSLAAADPLMIMIYFFISRYTRDSLNIASHLFIFLSYLEKSLCNTLFNHLGTFDTSTMHSTK